MKILHPFIPQRFLSRPRTEQPSDGTDLLYERHTEGGLLRVEETHFRGHRSRLLIVDGALESAMPLEEGQHHLLLFPYMRGFDLAFGIHPSIRSTLLIGGGGLAYPRHYLRTKPGRALDIVEISSDMINVSRRFFDPDKQFQYDPAGPEEAGTSPVRLFETDGFSYLLSCAGRYDLILCDAFTGRKEDDTLFSSDGIMLIHAHLEEGGICMANLISAVKGPLMSPGLMIKRRFSSVFRNVSLFQADDSRSPYESQNCLLIASDRDLA